MQHYPGKVTLEQAQLLANEGCAIIIWEPTSTTTTTKTCRLLMATHSNGRKCLCDQHGTIQTYTFAEAREVINTHQLEASADAIAWRQKTVNRRNITLAEAVFLKERGLLRNYIVRPTTDQLAHVLTFNPGKHRQTLSHDNTRKPIRFHKEQDTHTIATLIGFHIETDR